MARKVLADLQAGGTIFGLIVKAEAHTSDAAQSTRQPRLLAMACLCYGSEAVLAAPRLEKASATNDL